MANLYVARVQWYDPDEQETREVYELRAAESLAEMTQRITEDYGEDAIVVCEIHPVGNDNVLIPEVIARHIIKDDFAYNELYKIVNYD